MPVSKEDIMRGKPISRRSFILGGLGAAGYLYYEYKAIAVQRYTVPIMNLPAEFEGFTILHLSDLHNKEYGFEQRYLVDLIRREQFDIIALTGDFIDRRNPQVEPIQFLLEGISDKPVFFVPGNHERATHFFIQDMLTNLGVTILNNDTYSFVKGQRHLWLLGVDDPYQGNAKLDKALARVTDNSPKILLAHAPRIFADAVAANIDLTLVGHTHGGQVRVPFLGAIVAPGQGFLPKYDYGHFQSENSHLIISGGLGESMLPIRVMNRPEIVLVSLIGQDTIRL
jgi:predicted MPP superfamily phosphohydrolase